MKRRNNPFISGLEGLIDEAGGQEGKGRVK